MPFSNANYDTHLSLAMIDVRRDQLNISLLSCRYLFRSLHVKYNLLLSYKNRTRRFSSIKFILTSDHVAKY